MGTNYYAIPKLNDDQKLKVIEAVKNNQMQDLKNLIPDQIHLGKSSVGWRFLFNRNDWQYYENTKELFDFIDKCEILDEYGQEISPKQFKELVEAKQIVSIEKYSDLRYANDYIIKNGYIFSKYSNFS